MPLLDAARPRRFGWMAGSSETSAGSCDNSSLLSLSKNIQFFTNLGPAAVLGCHCLPIGAACPILRCTMCAYGQLPLK
ncbi:hypothetical protein BN2475_750018 [Paraburkholderia ribeironis]|uniref:Uncharacterized protein n=1 Tax=Paraburkholderia ribeironis TaxID=1247936 RepID=A0A1N7SJD9_9BURK|nr:hypothetical protein BN2475_750018 [Paraburkholderia ribeironis]